MKIKLLYFDLHLPYLINNDSITVGGTAIEWNNWFHGFEKNGIDIELLTWKGAKKYIQKKHSIQIRESYKKDKGIKVLRVLYYRIPALYKAIKRSQATHVIQQNSSWIAGVLAIISKLQGKKFILRIASDSDANIWSAPSARIRDKLGYWLAIKSADIIFCQNKFQYNELVRKNSSKTVQILYNPIKIGKKDGSTIDRNIGRSYVAWVGKFTPVKNLPVLFEVASSLPDINFQIVGQRTNSTRQIEIDTVLKLMELKNVNIIDHLDSNSILDFLIHSQLLLNTSNYEGLSNTFLEALLVGTPIVTTEKVDPDNMISANQLGFVAKDSREISDHIKNINKNIDYNSFYDRSYSFVKQNFDSIDQSAKFVEFLQN